MTVNQLASATRDFIMKSTWEVIAKKIPVIGVIKEILDDYDDRVHAKQAEQFLESLRNTLAKHELLWNEEWVKSEDGKKFVKKVVASALNAEYAEKQELFAQALVNGTILGDATTPEKYKYIDVIRELSRPALDVLAFYSKSSARESGQNIETLTARLHTEARAKADLPNMDFYMIYACLVEIQKTGLLSNVTSVHTHQDGRVSVGSSYTDVRVFTEFTAKFVAFVQEPIDQSKK
jgi:hypothetical protein